MQDLSSGHGGANPYPWRPGESFLILPKVCFLPTIGAVPVLHQSMDGGLLMFRNGVLAFLGLSLVGLLGWILVRFTRPILGVSHEGFLILTLLSLAFVVALCLVQLAFQPRKTG